MINNQNIYNLNFNNKFNTKDRLNEFQRESKVN